MNIEYLFKGIKLRNGLEAETIANWSSLLVAFVAFRPEIAGNVPLEELQAFNNRLSLYPGMDPDGTVNDPEFCKAFTAFREALEARNSPTKNA